MDVELRLFAMVREAVGVKTKTYEFESDATVRDALAALENDYPELAGTLLTEDDEIARSLTVLRNGTNVTHFNGAVTKLRDDDRLSITPPVTGG